MKHTSPTLLALAAILAVPSAYALDVKDDDVKMGLAVRIQARAEVNDAENAAGALYDANTGNLHGGDPVDFYLHRVRFAVKGNWKNDYFFNVTMAADSTAAKGANFQAYETYIGYKMKDEASGLTHSFQTGLANAFFNGIAHAYSSSEFLFPGGRATELMLASRGVGIAYMLTAPVGRFGIDIQNNIGDSATKQDGLFYSARLELTPPGEMGIKKTTESFLGKEGKGILVALGYGSNVRDRTTVAAGVTTTSYGVEVLGHFDGLTALAEFRTQTAENMTPNASPKETKGEVWLVQAGYALPLYDGVIEPAIRYTAIDLNKDNDTENAVFGKKDYGNSGTQIDVGVNYYIHGHNNKVQVAYTNWTGEENAAGDEASADIYRVQWQLNF